MRGRTVTVACIALAWCALVASMDVAPAEASVRVDRLRERLYLLDGYLEHFANAHFNFYPAPALVHKGGIPAPVWPNNPWTGRPMKPGTGPGDFTYSTRSRRLGCTLTGHYPGGSIVVRSGVPYTRKMQNDHRSLEGAQLIQRFADEWARRHGGRAPTATELAPDGAVGTLRSIYWWPHNPWTHERMHQGTAWGDFTYRVDPATGIYTIILHKSRGGAYWLRGPFSKTLAPAITSNGSTLYQPLASRLHDAAEARVASAPGDSALLRVAASSPGLQMP